MKNNGTIGAAMILALLCAVGCTVVSYNRVFPKLSWYWSGDAVEQRKGKAWEKNQREHGIPNFAVVEPGLYRGGEPTPEGWQYLQSLGVCKTLRLDYTNEIPVGVTVPSGILDAQGEMPPSDLADFLKAPKFHDLWLRAVWIDAALHKKHIDPLLSGFSNKTDWEVGIYLSAGMTTNCPVVFVHCLHGQDRTGIVIAFYRVLFCGWTKVDAEKEMLAHGFHKELIGLWEKWEKWEPKNLHQIYWE